jgi:hypothetical protein
MGHGAQCRARDQTRALARRMGWSTALEALAMWLPSSQCGRPPGSYVIAALRVIKIKKHESNHRKK